MKALNMNKSFQAACLVSVLALSACASNNPQDPYEPYNRAMYRFNDKVDTAVVQPLPMFLTISAMSLVLAVMFCDWI